MANDIKFITGYKNGALGPLAQLYGDAVSCDITEYLRGIPDGYTVDYQFFKTRSSNANFTNHTVYTTFTDYSVPYNIVNVPEFWTFKLTRQQMHDNYAANTYHPILSLYIGEKNGVNYFLTARIWWTSIDTNGTGSVDHFHVQIGIVSNDGYENYYRFLSKH